MSDRGTVRSDSLELVLDTICNMFGGVVFIAILLVVMVQFTGQVSNPRPRQAVAASDIVELSDKVRKAREEVTVLQQAARNQDHLLRQFAPEDIKELLAARERSKARSESLARERDCLLLEIARAEAQIQSIRTNIDLLYARLIAARRDLEKVRATAEAERAARTQDAHMPVVHDTTKQSIVVIVRYGRMYLWHRYGTLGVREGLNTQDFVVIRENAFGIVTAPRPTAGITLTGSSATRDAIAARLKRFSPDRYYAELAVHTDSFAEFRYLRDALVKLGYEYSLLPLQDGSTLADRGGSFRGVQ